MKERLNRNDLGLKILSFLAACVLWLVVVNIDDPISYKTFSGVPVNVINAEVLAAEQQTYQIVDDTQTISVTVRAKRSVLGKIRFSEITAVADMKELTLKTQVPIKVSVGDFNDRCESVEANPKNLQVKLEKEEIKKFPIVPVASGTVRDGYIVGKITAVPEKVSIRGPKSTIDKISRVEAVVNVSGLSANTTLPTNLQLYDANNNEIDQNILTNNLGDKGVGVNVELLETKSVPIEFDESEIVPASGYRFKDITYEPQEVRVAGTRTQLDRLDVLTIPPEVLKMEGVKERTEKVVDISKYLPKGIQMADENASSIVVTVNIERNGTKTFDLTVASISVNNLPKNMSMTFDTVDAIQVIVQGPRALLNSYTPERNLSIDLAGYNEPGIYDVMVQVDLPDGCTLEKEVSVKVVLQKE